LIQYKHVRHTVHTDRYTNPFTELTGDAFFIGFSVFKTDVSEISDNYCGPVVPPVTESKLTESELSDNVDHGSLQGLTEVAIGWHLTATMPAKGSSLDSWEVSDNFQVKHCGPVVPPVTESKLAESECNKVYHGWFSLEASLLGLTEFAIGWRTQITSRELVPTTFVSQNPNAEYRWKDAKYVGLVFDREELCDNDVESARAAVWRSCLEEID